MILKNTSFNEDVSTSWLSLEICDSFYYVKNECFKISKILMIPNLCLFFLAPIVVELLAILYFFHQIKFPKHIWDPCCHLVAEDGSWCILIAHLPIETNFSSPLSPSGARFEPLNHRHLRNIDSLTARTACLVWFSSTVNGRSKRKRKEGY